MSQAMLDRIERFYDAVPRSAARVEALPPLVLFVHESAGWSYYARPMLGASAFTAADVERVRARQQELGVGESFEWVAETTPSLRAAVEATGLVIVEYPLMLLDAAHYAPAALDDGLTARMVGPDDDIARIEAVARLGFGAPGTAVGEVGVEALDGAAAPMTAEQIASRQERLRSGHLVTFAVLDRGEPVCIGSHQPVGGVTEIVGVATLPAYRRRGIAGAVTSLLVDDALARGVETIFLSAGGEDVARVYARLGFERIGTACIAEPAGG